MTIERMAEIVSEQQRVRHEFMKLREALGTGKITRGEHDHYINTVYGGKDENSMLAELDRLADASMLADVVDETTTGAVIGKQRHTAQFLAMLLLGAAFAFGAYMVIAGDQAVTGLVTWGSSVADFATHPGDAITGFAILIG